MPRSDIVIPVINTFKKDSDINIQTIQLKLDSKRRSNSNTLQSSDRVIQACNFKIFTNQKKKEQIEYSIDECILNVEKGGDEKSVSQSSQSLSSK